MDTRLSLTGILCSKNTFYDKKLPIFNRLMRFGRLCTISVSSGFITHYMLGYDTIPSDFYTCSQIVERYKWSHYYSEQSSKKLSEIQSLISRYVDAELRIDIQNNKYCCTTYGVSEIPVQRTGNFIIISENELDHILWNSDGFENFKGKILHECGHVYYNHGHFYRIFILSCIWSTIIGVFTMNFWPIKFVLLCAILPLNWLLEIQADFFAVNQGYRFELYHSLKDGSTGKINWHHSHPPTPFRLWYLFGS
jgi:hypothetical protein